MSGLTVYNDSGIIQIDENYKNLQFVQKFILTGAGDHPISLSGCVAPVLVAYSTDTYGLVLKSQTVSGSSYSWVINGIGEIYVFDVPVSQFAHEAGLQVFNSAGACVFDSGNAPMIIRDVRTWTGNGNYWVKAGYATPAGFYPVQTLGTTSSTLAGNQGYNIVEEGGGPAYAKPSGAKWGWILVPFSTSIFVNTHAAGGPSYGDGNVHRGYGAIHASGDNFVVTFRDNIYSGTYTSSGITASWTSLVTFIDLTTVSNASGSGATTVTTSQSPGNQSQSTSATSYTFPSETVSVVGGTASSYSWSITNASGGTWGIASGQGTATAAAMFSGGSAGNTYTAVQQCVATVNGFNYSSQSALSYTIPSTPVLSVSNLSPGDQGPASSANSAYQFGAESVTVAGNSGAPSYSWSVSGTGGSWSIIAGQGTYQATPYVTGVASGTTASGTITCTVVVDGQTFTRSASLSFANTTSVGGVTFTNPPGTYNTGSDFFSTTASQTVTWSWTKTGSTGRNTTSPTTSGSATQTFSTTQSDSSTGTSTVCTVALSASGGFSWNITVTSPGNGGGSTCVWADAWVETPQGFKQARHIFAGDFVRVLTDDCEDTLWQQVTTNHLHEGDMYELRSKSGYVLWCSDETPLTLRDGSVIFPKDLKGHNLPIYDAEHGLRWEPCRAKKLRKRMPIAKISCMNKTYAAGNVAGQSILTHNIKA